MDNPFKSLTKLQFAAVRHNIVEQVKLCRLAKTKADEAVELDKKLKSGKLFHQ